MKLGEVRTLLVNAVKTDKVTPDVRLWLGRLRSRGWPAANIAPFTYTDLLTFVRDGMPELTRADFESFMSSCDDAEDRS